MNYSQSNNKKRMRRYRSPGKKLVNKVGYLIFRVFVSAILIGAFALTGAGIGLYMGVIQGAPSIESLNIDLLEGSSDTFIFDAHGNEIARLDGGTNRIVVEWDEISPHLKNAMVAIEDERFWEHNGMDAPGAVRAVYQTLLHGNLQGASTITQQVVKMDLGVTRNTIETKLQEQYLAIQFEAYLTELLGSTEAAKERILLRYLNMVPLGHGQDGVEAAAWRYFNKPASEITLSEAVVIAAITSNPTQRSPIRFPDWNRERAVVALDNMLRLGMITEEEHREAYNDDVYARIQQVSFDHFTDDVIWHSFVDAVVFQMTEDLMEMGMSRRDAQAMLFSGGLHIHTTMDPTAQRIMDEAFLNEEFFPTNPQDFEYRLVLDLSVRNELTGQVRHMQTNSDVWGTRVTNRDMFDDFIHWAESTLLGMDDVIIADTFVFMPQPQSSMVIIDHSNGHVIAMAGQRGEKQTNRSLNRATESERSPGSVFKIFAGFAPAFDMGLITAATGFDDTPNIRFDHSLGREVVWPRNWHNSYRGFNTARRSIEMSYNVISAKLIQEVGPHNAYNYLLNFGFTTIGEEDSGNPAMVLGGLSRGVTNLETTAAMGAIANGGILHRPILYTRVYDRNGEILIDNTILSPSQVLNRNSAYVLVDTMRGVLTQGTGGTARFRNIAMDNMGKTGTSQEGRDLYYSGSTPHLSASVWLGHDIPKPMTTHVTGSAGNHHMRVWSHVMEQVHIELDLEHRTFERPQGFVHHSVCSISGMLPGAGCSTRSELFAPGTVPSRSCHIHVEYTINIVTGMIPCQWCPPEQVRTGWGILRDRSWMDVAGDVNLPDSHLEVPRAVREGIICNVHGPFGAGYGQLDLDNIYLDDQELADLIYQLLHGNQDDEHGINDTQYEYPHGFIGDDNNNLTPVMPGETIGGDGGGQNQQTTPDTTMPTPTPMPDRTPIGIPESTPPAIITNPDLPPADPGSPPTPTQGPIITNP